ncbi:MAG: hypothetical protein Q9222_004776 [Ikaeria aurantiellina]
MVRMLAARLEDEQRARQQQTRDSDQRAHSHVDTLADGKPSQASIFSSRVSANTNDAQPPPVPDFLAPSVGKSKSSLEPKPAAISSAQHVSSKKVATSSPQAKTQTLNTTPYSHHSSTTSSQTVTDPGLPAKSPIQPFSAWPLPDMYLKPIQQQQSPSQDTLCSPCPSHSSSTSTISTTQDPSSSYFSPYMAAAPDFTNSFIPCDTLLPPDELSFNSMDAAISARLNLPCQDQGMWWPQSNITGNETLISSDQMGPMIENWIPEEDLAGLQVPLWG